METAYGTGKNEILESVVSGRDSVSAIYSRIGICTGKCGKCRCAAQNGVDKYCHFADCKEDDRYEYLLNDVTFRRTFKGYIGMTPSQFCKDGVE